MKNFSPSSKSELRTETLPQAERKVNIINDNNYISKYAISKSELRLTRTDSPRRTSSSNPAGLRTAPSATISPSVELRAELRQTVAPNELSAPTPNSNTTLVVGKDLGVPNFPPERIRTGTTGLFRSLGFDSNPKERKAFEYFIGSLVEKTLKGHSIRVLSVGASTGEEAFSLAASLIEKGVKPSLLSVVGIDISESRIRRAQTGVINTLAEPMPEIYREYFSEQANGAVQPKQVVMDAVEFKIVDAADREAMSQLGTFDGVAFNHVAYQMGQKELRRTLKNLSMSLNGEGLMISNIGLVTNDYLFVRNDRSESGFSAAVLRRPEVKPELRRPASFPNRLTVGSLEAGQNGKPEGAKPNKRKTRPGVASIIAILKKMTGKRQAVRLLKELQNAGRNPDDISWLLRILSHTKSTAQENIGFWYWEAIAQFRFIQEDFRARVRKLKQMPAAVPEIVIYELGLGSIPTEALAVIDSFGKIMTEELGDESKKWKLTFIGMDNQAALVKTAKRHFLAKEMELRALGFNKVLLKAVKADAMMLQSLVKARQSTGNGSRADYIFHRHVNYSNRHLSNWATPLAQTPINFLADGIGVYIQSQNLVRAFAKNGTRYIVEPVIEESRADDLELVIPGAKLLTDAGRTITGIYDIEDAAVFAKTNFGAFLQGIVAFDKESRRAELRRSDAIEKLLPENLLPQGTKEKLTDIMQRARQVQEEAAVQSNVSRSELRRMVRKAFGFSETKQDDMVEGVILTRRSLADETNPESLALGLHGLSEAFGGPVAVVAPDGINQIITDIANRDQTGRILKAEDPNEAVRKLIAKNVKNIRIIAREGEYVPEKLLQEDFPGIIIKVERTHDGSFAGIFSVLRLGNALMNEMLAVVRFAHDA